MAVVKNTNNVVENKLANPVNKGKTRVFLCIKIYNLITIITGLLYDILYTNLLFFHAIIFFLLGIIIKYLYKNYNQQRRLINIMSLIIVLTTYIFLTASSLYLFKITNVKIVEIIEFISKSMTLNIIYLVLLTK